MTIKRLTACLDRLLIDEYSICAHKVLVQDLDDFGCERKSIVNGRPKRKQKYTQNLHDHHKIKLV